MKRGGPQAAPFSFETCDLAVRARLTVLVDSHSAARWTFHLYMVLGAAEGVDHVPVVGPFITADGCTTLDSGGVRTTIVDVRTDDSTGDRAACRGDITPAAGTD